MDAQTKIGQLEIYLVKVPHCKRGRNPGLHMQNVNIQNP